MNSLPPSLSLPSVKYLSAAVEMDPKSAAAQNNLGLAYYHLNPPKFKESIDNFNHAINDCEGGQKEPNFYFHRGNTQLALRAHKEAREDFVRAINLKRDVAKYHHSMGLVLQETGETEGAIENFNNALTLSLNTHIPSLYHLGLMHHAQKEYSDAVAAFDRVAEKEPEDRLVYESRGLVYQDMQNHAKAVDDFTMAVSKVCSTVCPQLLFALNYCLPST